MSSDLGVNKIAGALLATGLAVVGLNIASGMAFAPHVALCGEAYAHAEEEGHHAAKAGYCVTPAPDGGTGVPTAPEPLPDWGTVLPTADIAAGQAAFTSKCASCHKPTDENGNGPGLNGVVGRKPAAHAGFTKYSTALQEYAGAHPQWTHDELNLFLTNPRKHIDGTAMTFVGLRNVDERIAVIGYLQSLGSSLGIPAPDPSRQAPAEGAAPTEGAQAESAPLAAGAEQATQPAPAAPPAAH